MEEKKKLNLEEIFTDYDSLLGKLLERAKQMNEFTARQLREFGQPGTAGSKLIASNTAKLESLMSTIRAVTLKIATGRSVH